MTWSEFTCQSNNLLLEGKPIKKKKKKNHVLKRERGVWLASPRLPWLPRSTCLTHSGRHNPPPPSRLAAAISVLSLTPGASLRACQGHCTVKLLQKEMTTTKTKQQQQPGGGSVLGNGRHLKRRHLFNHTLGRAFATRVEKTSQPQKSSHICLFVTHPDTAISTPDSRLALIFQPPAAARDSISIRSQ